MNGSLEHLNNSECVTTFTQTFESQYDKLLLVTNNMRFNDSKYDFLATGRTNNGPNDDIGSIWASYEWLYGLSYVDRSYCPFDNSDISTFRSQIANNNNSWYIGRSSETLEIRWKVEYCLAEKASQYCKLQYSFPITITLIAVNIVKSMILLYIWVGLYDPPILTIGDAIASLLQREDIYTQGGCLLTWKDKTRQEIKPKPFLRKKRRWGSAVSIWKWISLIVPWVCVAVANIYLLKYAESRMGPDDSNFWEQGLGTAGSENLVTGTNWPSSFVPIVLIANSPQLIFSILYFTFNGFLTSMTLAAEWSNYAIHRKGLRVSNNPRSSQRSNYFLSMPYRYSVPLMITSAILHWLISQSFFVVAVEYYSNDGPRNHYYLD
ncbi:hypothetical protein N7495_002621 [Penicillium taxi]|uniref:uncharacterized protein n=1 Tax=Penicillium taxi TaxID=168475 RepID=UPI002545BDA4|nr:uncharacterized protein N7495_002621 [Penicillium taxi]KAJ5902093.1 hypothetical protein N7495_002621 [Penicillium taxi]